MKLRRRERDEPQINLTPLIDVVFLLLIFFMVSTTFERDSQLSIELPEASAEPEVRADKALEVAIDAQGRFYVNGRQLVNTRTATVVQALSNVAVDDFTLPVVISADANTPYQAVITVMDAARQAGFVNLSLPVSLTNEQASQ